MNICESSGVMALGSDAASGWAGWALAHLEFGSSVNPITTREGRSVYVAVPKQNTEYQYWKHTEVSLPV